MTIALSRNPVLFCFFVIRNVVAESIVRTPKVVVMVQVVVVVQLVVMVRCRLVVETTVHLQLILNSVVLTVD